MKGVTKWDLRFLDLAKLVSAWSKDPSTKCGAVIVRPDRTVASLGFNGFPKGMKDDPARLKDREEKYSCIIHAEMNAVLLASEDLKGYVLYTHPFLPCDRCMVHMIQVGITRVVAYAPQTDRWKESITKGITYADEAGVMITEYPHEGEI